MRWGRLFGSPQRRLVRGGVRAAPPADESCVWCVKILILFLIKMLHFPPEGLHSSAPASSQLETTVSMTLHGAVVLAPFLSSFLSESSLVLLLLTSDVIRVCRAYQIFFIFSSEIYEILPACSPSDCELGIAFLPPVALCERRSRMKQQAVRIALVRCLQGGQIQRRP